MTAKQSPRRGPGASVAFRGAEISIPTLRPVSVTIDRRGVRLVVVRCPFCSRQHTHGWPPESEDVGTRLAHCGGVARVYRIEAR